MNIDKMPLILLVASVVLVGLIWGVVETNSPGSLQRVEREGKAFLVSYEAEKKGATSVNQGDVKSFSSFHVQSKEAKTEFHKNEVSAQKAAEKKVKEIYPEEDGWVNHKIKVEVGP